MGEEQQYDLGELKRLWKLDYESLAMAPAEPNGRLREVRFVLQAKVALETRLCMRVLRRRRPMELHTIGIDLGKTVFHMVGLNLRGEVVVRKKFSRTQLLRFTANIHVGLIGMEACGGAHFLGRALREQSKRLV